MVTGEWARAPFEKTFEIWRNNSLPFNNGLHYHQNPENRRRDQNTHCMHYNLKKTTQPTKAKYQIAGQKTPDFFFGTARINILSIVGCCGAHWMAGWIPRGWLDGWAKERKILKCCARQNAGLVKKLVFFWYILFHQDLDNNVRWKLTIFIHHQKKREKWVGHACAPGARLEECIHKTYQCTPGCTRGHLSRTWFFFRTCLNSKN